jgi:hypothetical protein
MTAPEGTPQETPQGSPQGTPEGSPPAGPPLPVARRAGGDGYRFPVGPVVLLGLLLVAAAAGVVLLLRPHLEVTNALAAPIRLVVADAPARTVAPGETIRLPVARGATLVAEWQMIRPLSADSQPMGEEVRGSTVLRQPSGTAVVRATARAGVEAYFAPLITNASQRPLRVMVNAGLAGARDCGCAVRPGTRRVFIGYYRLFRNSTVEASGGVAGRARFEDLGPQVTAADGTVGLRFEDRDLRP